MSGYVNKRDVVNYKKKIRNLLLITPVAVALTVPLTKVFLDNVVSIFNPYIELIIVLVLS